MFTFRRQRTRSERTDERGAVYQQQRHAAAVEARRKATHEARERELDEWDAQMYEAWEITDAANTLALWMAMGMAAPAEVEEFLTMAHDNPYADIASVEFQCVALGLDLSTGAPLHG